jgi:hypothetical protein
MANKLKVVQIEVSLCLGNETGVEAHIDIKENFLKYHGVSENDINALRENVKDLSLSFSQGIEKDYLEFRKNPSTYTEAMLKEIISKIGGNYEN